jgi:hypothetical protein
MPAYPLPAPNPATNLHPTSQRRHGQTQLARLVQQPHQTPGSETGLRDAPPAAAAAPPRSLRSCTPPGNAKPRATRTPAAGLAVLGRAQHLAGVAQEQHRLDRVASHLQHTDTRTHTAMVSRLSVWLIDPPPWRGFIEKCAPVLMSMAQNVHFSSYIVIACVWVFWVFLVVKLIYLKIHQKVCMLHIKFNRLYSTKGKNGFTSFTCVCKSNLHIISFQLQKTPKTPKTS